MEHRGGGTGRASRRVRTQRHVPGRVEALPQRLSRRGVADLFPRGGLTDFEAARRRPSLRGGEPYEGAGLGLREGKPGRHLGRPSRRRRRSAPWLNEQLVWWKGSADELRIVSPRAENG